MTKEFVRTGPTPSARREAQSALKGLRLGALCVRAARMGVEAAALDAAEASADPKAALVELTSKFEMSSGTNFVRRLDGSITNA